MTELVFVTENPHFGPPPSVAPPSVSPPGSPTHVSTTASPSNTKRKNSDDADSSVPVKEKKKKKKNRDGEKKRHRKVPRDSEKKKKDKRKEEEEEPSVINIDDDDEEEKNIQQALLASVSRPSAAPLEVESPAVARLVEAGVVPPAPDNYVAPEAQPEPMPAPVASESGSEYHVQMMKFKGDRLHHPYYHATVSAAEMVQFFRPCSNSFGSTPLQFAIPLNHMYYAEAIGRLMDQQMDVRHFLDWLKAHFAPGSLGLNQVAVHVHTFVIPDDMPGEWAKYGL